MKKKIADVKKEEGVIGRPREFDIDAALEKAMRLFWAKGYEGTSVGDLTETLGISRPSLYAAFGDKQSLFRAALERYAAGPAGYVAVALGKPTAREVAEHLLSRLLKNGCFAANSATQTISDGISCASES
jgi:AcrR family transcriptional regulator